MANVQASPKGAAKGYFNRLYAIHKLPDHQLGNDMQKQPENDRFLNNAVTVCIVIGIIALIKSGSTSSGLSPASDSSTYGYYGNQRVTNNEMDGALSFLERQGLDRDEGRKAIDPFLNK